MKYTKSVSSKRENRNRSVFYKLKAILNKCVLRVFLSKNNLAAFNIMKLIWHNPGAALENARPPAAALFFALLEVTHVP